LRQNLYFGWIEPPDFFWAALPLLPHLHPDGVLEGKRSWLVRRNIRRLLGTRRQASPEARWRLASTSCLKRASRGRGFFQAGQKSASRKLNPTAIQLSETCPRPSPQHQAPTGFPTFGTISVQLSERKSGTLLPTRHQTKHLRFCSFIVRDQGVGGSNPLSPTNFFKIK